MTAQEHVAAKLARVMGEAGGKVPKSRNRPNNTGGGAYSDVDDIVGTVRPLLAREGIVVLPQETGPGRLEGGQVIIEMRAEVTDGTTSIVIGPFTAQGEDRPAATGAKKAQTAAIRYLLSYGLLLGGQDADDEQAHGQTGGGGVAAGGGTTARTSLGPTPAAPPQPTEEAILPEQRRRLFVQAEERGMPTDKVRELVVKETGQPHSDRIPRSKYDAILNGIANWQAPE